MLKDFAVFYRYCNPHKGLLFLGTACRCKSGFTARRKHNVASLNTQPFTIHQTIGHFRTGSFVYTRYRGPRNTHTSGSFFLTHFL